MHDKKDVANIDEIMRDVNGTMYQESWRRIKKDLEAHPRADNTGSPKLPSFKEVCSLVGGIYTEDSNRGKYLRVQSKEVYDCMVRQLRAGA